MRDEQWSSYGGALAELLRDRSVRSVDINFSATSWADPAPLLSLFALLGTWKKRVPQGAIRVDLGRHRAGDGNRFLLFLAAQGFLRALEGIVSWIWQGKPHESEDLIPRLRDLGSVPVFQNADCIHATLLDASALRGPNLSEVVERLVKQASNQRIDRWLAPRQRGFLLTKLRLVLTETLDNVAEHAYAKDGVGAIYARIRFGIPEDPAEFDRWSRAQLLERRYCPGLARSGFGKRPGWLELFVCDVGMGITHRLTRSTKAPLLQLSGKLFRDAISRHTNRAAANKTQVTGLQHIGFMLRGASDGDRGDFVRIYSQGEWIGEHLPWPEGQLQPAHRNYRSAIDSQFVPGTCFHFGIEPPPAELQQQRLMYPKLFHLPVSEDLKSVRVALSKTAEPPELPAHDFFDNFADPKEGAGRGELAHEWIAKLDSTTVVIRPSRSIRKGDFVDQLLQMMTTRNGAVTNIIYADVPPSVAIDLSYILSEERFFPRSPTAASLTVFIVSQDWSSAAFKLRSDKQTFENSNELARGFFAAAESQVSASFVASLLRRRDSELFWRLVRDSYLNEPVNWSSREPSPVEKDLVIQGYLDIASALAPSDLFEVARRCFRRALTSFAHYAATSCDELVRQLVEMDFDARDLTHAPATQQGKERLVIAGSVLVTGTTSARYASRTDVDPVGIVHLLKHVSSPVVTIEDGATLFAMLWIPVQQRPKSYRRRYKRVANSPYIVRGGEGAIPLPRFAAPIGERLGRSLYGMPPADAYRHWQQLGLLRMGHWTYNQSHDLLTINLGDALDYDRLDGGRIVPWIASTLANWHAEFSARKRPWAIVYPRHRVTDNLIRLLRKGGLALPSVFPLQLMQASSVSPLMVSPVERERLGQHLTKYFKAGGLVTLIDDGVITGKTMDQLSQFVEGLWEVLRTTRAVRPDSELEVRTLAILDRSGLPTQRGLVERRTKQHPRFWRWDVPPLGHSGSCALCMALDRCRDVKTRLDGAELDSRLGQWIETWAAVAVNNFERGLTPRRLPPGDSTRFCIEQLPNGGELTHEVQHLLSTSRASIAAEVCRSTTRKDYPLEKAKWGKFKDGSDIDAQTKIEILATQVLLFLGELTFAERVERLTSMLDLLWSVGETSSTTALAGIAVTVDAGIAPALWQHCAMLIEKKGFANDDALICAFALYEIGHEKIPPDHSNKAWALLQLLIASPTTTRGALCRIFQVFGPDANSFHQGLLLDLLKKRAISATDVHQILLMLETLARALDAITLNPDIVGKLPLEPDRDAGAIRQQMLRIKALARRYIPEGIVESTDTTAIRLLASTILENADARAQASHLLDTVYTELFVGSTSFQSRYRTNLAIKLEGDSPTSLLVGPLLSELYSSWEERLEHKEDRVLSARWKKDGLPLVLFAETGWNEKSVYVYRDAMVRRALTEALSNVMHRSHPIRCPWPGFDALGEADMWVRVQANQNGRSIRVEMVNGAVVDRTELRPQQTVSAIHLTNIGGSRDLQFDDSNNLFRMTLHIPTLAGLAWQAS